MLRHSSRGSSAASGLLFIGNRGTIFQSDSLAAASLSGRFTPAGFDLSIRGEVGILYELQAANSLSVPDWTPIRAFTFLKANTNVVDTASLTNSQRFYRVIAP